MWTNLRLVFCIGGFSVRKTIYGVMELKKIHDRVNRIDAVSISKGASSGVTGALDSGSIKCP